MNIVALTVTRGDRPELLKHCKFFVANQSLMPEQHITIDYKPLGKYNDCAERYKAGFEMAFNMFGANVVVIFEDDDYYAPNYIENIIKLWNASGNPSCFGYNKTTYYHTERLMYRELQHNGRASMCNSLFTREVLKCDFGDLTNPFLDLRLWKQMKGIAVSPVTLDSIGIKHNTGKTSGAGHLSTFKYTHSDPNKEYFNQITGNYYAQHNNNTPK